MDNKGTPFVAGKKFVTALPFADYLLMIEVLCLILKISKNFW